MFHVLPKWFYWMLGEALSVAAMFSIFPTHSIAAAALQLVVALAVGAALVTIGFRLPRGQR